MDNQIWERPKCQIKDCEEWALMLIDGMYICGKHIAKLEQKKKEKAQKEIQEMLE